MFSLVKIKCIMFLFHFFYKIYFHFNRYWYSYWNAVNILKLFIFLAFLLGLSEFIWIIGYQSVVCVFYLMSDLGSQMSCHHSVSRLIKETKKISKGNCSSTGAKYQHCVHKLASTCQMIGLEWCQEKPFSILPS